jgi:ribosome-associated protein
MDIRKLQRAIVDGLEDVKAQNIVVFNTEAMSPLFERVIIATGASNRQTKALAYSVRDAVKSRGMQVLRMEGEDNGEWIIVDCGAAVAHIMQPGIRDYYHLEEIWGEKPVSLKLGGGAPKGLPKASEDFQEADEPAPAKKPVAAKKARPQKVAAAPAPAKKVAAKKAPAKKAPARKSALRSAPTKASPTKTAPAKAAPRKTAASKVVVAKAPARKAAVARKTTTAPAKAARPTRSR